MRTKEEVEAVVLALHRRMNDADSDFSRGLLHGAIDALSWSMEEEYSLASKFFAHYADHQLKAKPKKLVLGTDHFAI